MCDDLDMVMVGNRIKERRKELHLNQKDIYNKCGITPGALSRIENGLNVPSISIVYKLAQILECSLDYLVGAKQHNISDIFNYDIFKNYQELSKDDQEDIDMMILLKFKRMVKSKEKEPKLFLSEEENSGSNIA